MKFLASLATVAVVVAGALAQTTLMVNTPANAVVCQPLLITWTGGTPPYFLSVHPGNQAGAAAIRDFGNVGDATSQSWVVNVAAGTSIGLNLRDSTGALSQSAPFSVLSSTDTACLNATSSGSSTGSRPSTSLPITTSTSSSATRSITTTTSVPTTTAPSTSATSNPVPASSASSPAPSSGASSKFAQIGMAGVLGAAAVVLMA